MVPPGRPAHDGRDWNASGAHVVGLFLNGEGLAAPGPQGERVEDDSFLLLFNASPDDCTFTIPSRRFGVAWTFVLSTADPNRPPGDETHKWHSKVTLVSRSFTLLRRAE